MKAPQLKVITNLTFKKKHHENKTFIELLTRNMIDTLTPSPLVFLIIEIKI